MNNCPRCHEGGPCPYCPPLTSDAWLAARDRRLRAAEGKTFEQNCDDWLSELDTLVSTHQPTKGDSM